MAMKRLLLCGMALLCTGCEDSPVRSVDVQPPLITREPQEVTAITGASAVFSILAQGDDINYQWQRDEKNCTGATSREYTVHHLSLRDSGALFRCIVTNSVGADTSIGAKLHVIE